MNAMLRIQVRIAANQAAQQLGQITVAMKAMEAQAKRMSSATNSAMASTSRGMKAAAAQGEKVKEKLDFSQMGKSLGAVGRQLTYQFTYPLMNAGKAAFGFAMANQAAFTQLKKVYGNTGQDLGQFTHELEQLSQVFELQSNIYGVAQDQVIGIGEAWAAAGKSGAALAKVTETTIQAMLLGDFSSQEEAVKSLIAIQTAYGLNAEGLSQAIADLNAVENETAITFTDLVTGFVRTGSTAEVAGVSIKELAADLAALVPVTGSAETAGNGLKTIFTRLMAPTQQASKAFEQLGVDFTSTQGSAKSAQQRLYDLSHAFEGLTDNQKVLIGTQIAGRFQVNRFLELMKELRPQLDGATGELSQFNKAMKATGEGSNTAGIAAQEIQTILQSTPQAFQILTTQWHNFIVDIITPLIPSLLRLMSMVQQLANAFASLDLPYQQLVVFLAIAVALAGPLLRIIALFAQMKKAFLDTLSILGSAASLLANPWVLLVVAIAAAVVAFIFFHDQVVAAVSAVWQFVQKAFQGIATIVVNAWNALPTAVRNAFQSVINIIARAIEIIIEQLSYLNPFAHHSPSLVESVDAGVDFIAKKYASLANIGTGFRRAADDFKAFQRATASASAGFAASDRAEQRGQIVSAAPNAGPQVDAMYASIDRLNGAMATLTDEYAVQKAAVDALEPSLTAAQAAYDAQKDTLTALQDQLDVTSAALDSAKNKLDMYANAPIAGMKAWSDAIFANDEAQKQLQLDIMKLEDAGGTYEDLQSKIAAINGEIETLRGKQQDLRSGGAGSDVLSIYDDQIAALQGQADAATAAADPIGKLQEQLDKLQRQGQEMDLEKSLNFDGLQKQIADLVDTSKELTFDEILAGIKATQPQVAALTAAYDQQKAAVDAQQVVVNQAKAASDAIQASYDAEKLKLDDLGKAYDTTEAQVRMLQQALDDLAQSYKSAQSAAAAGGGVGGGGGGAGGAGGGGLGPGELTAPTAPEGGGDLDAYIEELKKKATSAFGNFDFFKPIKEAWDRFTAWWNSTVVPAWDSFLAGFSASNLSVDISGLQGFASGVVDAITSSPAWGVLKGFFGQIGQDIGPTLSSVFQSISEGLGELGGSLSGFAPMWEPLKGAVENIMKLIGIGFIPILLQLKGVWDIFTNVVGPAVKLGFDSITTAITFARDILQIVLDLLSGNFKAIPGDVADLFKDMVGRVKQNLEDLLKFIVGLAKGIVKAFLDEIGTLAGLLLPLFAAAGTWLIDAGIAIIKGLWDGVVQDWNLLYGWLNSIGQWIIDLFLAAGSWLLSAGIAVIKGLWDGLVIDWNLTYDWLNKIGGWIIDAFSAAAGWLLGAGQAVIQGLWDGMKNVWNSAWGWITSIGGWIGGAFSAAYSWLTGAGASVIQGLFDGMKNVWNNVVWPFITGIGGAIGGALGDAGTWLLSIGGKVIQGLWDGMQLIWNSLVTWIGGLPDLAVKALGNFASAFKDAVVGAVKGAWNTAADFLNSAFSHIPTIHIPGTNVTIEAPNIPHIATGGIIPGYLGQAVPAILHGGEIVLNPRQQSNLLWSMAHLTGPTATAQAGGSRVVNINGDLSFPNITKPEDAETFIRNLETLAAS